MYDPLTDEIYEEIHAARLRDTRFKQIVKDLFEKHGLVVGYRICNERYLAWCARKNITPRKKLRHRPIAKLFFAREEEVSTFTKRQQCLLHLLDLVRAHGEIVTNRLTGEVVEGGYPNLNIPDIGTPRVVTPYYHGSLVGSSSASCSEVGQ